MMLRIPGMWESGQGTLNTKVRTQEIMWAVGSHRRCVSKRRAMARAVYMGELVAGVLG